MRGIVPSRGAAEDVVGGGGAIPRYGLVMRIRCQEFYSILPLLFTISASAFFTHHSFFHEST